MRILAIDPGSEKSAFVQYDAHEALPILQCGIVENKKLIDIFSFLVQDEPIMAIEGVACYGMPVGKSVFQTCEWIGRFRQAWRGPSQIIYRHQIKMAICHNSRAKDANIRQALIDMFPATGGGKCPQVGTKAAKGPLYGVRKDIWSALAVAVTASKLNEREAQDV